MQRQAPQDQPEGTAPDRTGADETAEDAPDPATLKRENRALGLRLAGLAALVLALAVGVALLVLHVETTYALPAH